MSNIPLVYSIKINALQKVIDGIIEIIFVAKKGGSIFSYLGLVSDLVKVISNLKTAKEEVKELNLLEIEALIQDNVSEILTKFDILTGESKFGIENVKQAIITAVTMAIDIKLALADGFQFKDIKILPSVIFSAMELYMLRKKIKEELLDIQPQEAEDLLVFLYGHIIELFGLE